MSAVIVVGVSSRHESTVYEGQTSFAAPGVPRSGVAPLPNAVVAVQYGVLINTLIQFLIVAFVVFLIVKGANAVRRRYEAEGPAEPAAPTPTEALLTEIRDLLKSR